MDSELVNSEHLASHGRLVTVLDLILKHEVKELDRKRQRLRGLETDKLRELAYVGILRKKRIAMFLASEELTRRGIPPCFRGLPDPNDDDAEQVADLLAIDLEWIASRYPQQKTVLGRWKNLASKNEKSRWLTIQFICRWQVREMYKYVKGLAMTQNQEWECHYLHRDKIRWAQDETKRTRADVAEKLRRRRYDRKLTLVTEKELADFERWLDVWACASMGAWESPTRVAWLYTAKTGNPLSKQMAAKIMDKLRRDLPAKRSRL